MHLKHNRTTLHCNKHKGTRQCHHYIWYLAQSSAEAEHHSKRLLLEAGHTEADRTEVNRTEVDHLEVDHIEIGHIEIGHIEVELHNNLAGDEVDNTIVVEMVGTPVEKLMV